VLGEDEYGGRRIEGGHPPGRFQAAHARHLQVHDHDIRRMLLEQPEGLLAATGFPDHLDPRLGGE
jgi:hypothetical protein